MSDESWCEISYSNEVLEFARKRFIEEFKEQAVEKRSVLDRLGGYPSNVLDARKDLSDRDVRKAIILEKLRNRYGSI